MLKSVLASFAIVQVAYCQYGSSNMATTSASAVTTAVGPGATTVNGGSQATTVSGGGQATTSSAGTGDCTAATDSVYLKQVQTLAGVENEVAATLAANPNAKPDNSSGFFLGIIIGTAQANQALQNILAGQNISGAQCLTSNQQLGVTIGQVEAHANDVVPQPLTGENKYQDMIRRLGSALNAILASAAACKSTYSSNAGPWLNVILTLNTNINGINTVVTNSDSSSNCLTASKAIAQSFSSILSSVNASG